MDQTPRRVALTRKVSLAQYADDWEECYAVVRLATYDEFVEFNKRDLKGMPNLEVLGVEFQVVADHFVSGKIMALAVNKQPELVDMTVEDTKASPAIIDNLFSVIMGIDLDPKDTPTTPPNNGASSNGENTTKTPSSTASQPGSQQIS